MGKRTIYTWFLVSVLVFAVVASGCIGGEETTTQTTPSSAQTTSSETTSSPTETQPAGPTYEVIETDKSVILVGPEGAQMPASLPSGKKVIKITYVVDEANTPSIQELMEKGQGFGAINPAFFRNTTVDALVIAARRETNPEIRTELFKALYILGNRLVPEAIIGQNRQLRVYWEWVKGRYYHPTLRNERYDLIWEDPNAPSVPIGIGDYKNDAQTYVIGTIGWPESFDPAWTYETFGWEIWHQVGDTLVTYWKEETEQVSPDLAVAWAHNEDGTEWYFVIRGGVVAYDPWNEKTYPIDATDVLFTFWRVQKLGHSVSWMVSSFMDISKSQALTESEFENVIKSKKLIADYGGKTVEVSSLQDLLSTFGYSGETAGVFKLVLSAPYAPILGVLTDPFLSVLPMEYILGDKYEEALAASNNGKNPDAWDPYVEEGEQDPTHQLMHKQPVGTGPFYVKEYKENAYIVLEHNPYYWDKSVTPGHERVIYVINNDAVSRIQLFQTATVDDVAVPPERVNDVKGLEFQGFKSVVQTDILQPYLTFIVFNTQKEPFNNPKVREALAYAIPYDQISQVVYSGLLERHYGPIPKPWPGYTEYGIIKYNYNINLSLIHI